jgi:Domain of unknown function (DUF4865)/Putative mono-oxygenase ydhR
LFALTVRFVLPEDTDWSKVPSLMVDRAESLYRKMPGLVSKAFLYDPNTLEYGGNYVWETREQLDAFLKSEVFSAAKAKFGEPSIRIHPIVVYLERGHILLPSMPLVPATP